MKSKSLLILGLSLLSCQNHNAKTPENEQDSLFKANGVAVLKEIKEMSAKDKDIRLFFTYGTTDPLKIDSLDDELNKMSFNADSLSFLSNYSLLSNERKDSVMKQMKNMETAHTIRMIELINIYGYPTSDRLKNVAAMSPMLIMQHPDPSFKDTLLTLLLHELKFGRIDTNNYEMLKWDLNGRTGIPHVKGIKVMKIDPKTGDTITINNGA